MGRSSLRQLLLTSLRKVPQLLLLFSDGMSKNSTWPRICGECQQGCAAGLEEHLVRELFAAKEVDWTKLLGQVMSVCNSHSGIQKNSVSSYEAEFGQKYHQQLQCNLSEMCECKSIFQRLKLSPNEWLQTYVREHNIVDIEVQDTDDNDNNDEDDRSDDKN